MHRVDVSNVSVAGGLFLLQSYGFSVLHRNAQQVLRVAEACTCPQPQGRGYLRFLPVGLDPEYRYGLITSL